MQTLDFGYSILRWLAIYSHTQPNQKNAIYIIPRCFNIFHHLILKFTGYNQQDAQEFLVYLLDGLHEDLNRIVNKPYQADDSIEATEQNLKLSAIQIWEKYLQRNNSIISDLITGMYQSKLTCPKCKNISIKFDPFLTIQLPIPNTNQIPIEFYLITRDPSIQPLKVLYHIDESKSFLDLKNRISKDTHIEPDHLKCYFVENNQLKKEYDDKESISMLDENKTTYVYQIYEPSWDERMDKFERKITIQLQICDHEERQVCIPKIIKVRQNAKFSEIRSQMFKYFRVLIFNYLKVCPGDELKEGLLRIFEYLNQSDEKFVQKDYLRFNKQPLYKLVCKRIPFDLPDLKDEMYNQVISEKIEFKSKDEELPIQMILIKNFEIKYFKFNTIQVASFSGTHGQVKSKDCELRDCFEQFSKPEVLQKGDEWYCNKCKEHVLATKSLNIYKLPQILIISLKRFKTSSNSSIGSFLFQKESKLTTLVKFPTEGLRLQNYYAFEKEIFEYSLFAISNHFGVLNSGHYTAYANNFLQQEWYSFNDQRVSKMLKDELVTSGAYVLFYRRVS